MTTKEQTLFTHLLQRAKETKNAAAYHFIEKEMHTYLHAEPIAPTSESIDLLTTNEIPVVIKTTKTAVIFELGGTNPRPSSTVKCLLTTREFQEFHDRLASVAKSVWPTLSPREANTEASDYYEYYDRELDNNGYLVLKSDGLRIESPFAGHERLYQFNKRKMESFLFDLNKQLSKIEEAVK